MQTFLMRLYERLQELRRNGLGAIRVVVIGGGVGGIEISLCLPSYLGRVAGGTPHAISIVDAESASAGDCPLGPGTRWSPSWQPVA